MELLKRRRPSPRRRRQITYLLFLTVILILIAGPYLWHIERLDRAESDYNVPDVKKELQWLDVHGGLLNNLELIKDAQLWLDLSQGTKDLEPKLAAYQDEHHRFRLFLLILQEGKLPEAQDILDRLGNTALGQLGQGLMSFVNGNTKETLHLLAETELDWKSLTSQEQTLRHLTLAKAAMLIGDQQSTHEELLRAQQLEPNNPACLSVGFDVALEEEQWAEALELSRSIDAQTWRPKNTLLETQRAVLAIHEDNSQELAKSLSALKDLPQGEACINYVQGIENLKKGQLQGGKNLMERALKSGLDGALKADAQKALDQVSERQKADQLLRSVGVGNGE